MEIRMADPAGLNLEPYLAGAWLWDLYIGSEKRHFVNRRWLVK
jgi:hypothetical protein